MSKPFASSADLADKRETLEEIADGVYALTAEGDPNVGAVVGRDGVLAFEARATPVMARRWIDQLRERTDKPFRYLVLSHYHAVRVLGAAAFDAPWIVAHEATAELVRERGQADWDSEAARMPRLFQGAETIPGLTHPNVTFREAMTIDLGDRAVELRHTGRGHTAGDLVVWLPDDRVLFAGDLVEAEAALYTGDAYHTEWMGGTLDRVAALSARALVGGRGPVVHGEQAVADAIAQTRSFLVVLRDAVAGVVRRGGTVKEAFEAAYAALRPRYGAWPIFEHTMPFNVQRMWDELVGQHPQTWTAERDRAVWDMLQG